NLKSWRQVVEQATTNHKRKLTVGVVAKYMDNTDTYMSVFEAIYAAAWANDAKVKIKWIDAERLKKDKDVEKALKGIDGVVVPGGFGTRGLEGKIVTAQYALRHKFPYLGLCLGLQMAVIAAARNAGVKKATTVELDPNGEDRVIDTMAGQEG